jgi:membrane associated rhomboid family serine protease
MMNITPAVKQLLIINIMVYIGAQIIGDSAYKLFSLYYFESPNFRFWQPITHMFMHDRTNIMHIAFNMFGLFSFGSMLEDRWGSSKFLFFYISCGLGAALLHSGMNYYYFHDGLNALITNGFTKAEVLDLLATGQIDTRWQTILSASDFNYFGSAYFSAAVGASGALYGLITAFAFMFPDAELGIMFIPIPIKAKYFVPVLVAFDLFSGVTGYTIFGGGNIAHFAHVGGALFGFIMMWYWKKNQFNNKRLY